MIKENIEKIRQEIVYRLDRVNDIQRKVTLVAVVKNQPLDKIKEVIRCGIYALGENRIQEALLHYQQLCGVKDLRWHMVGHLQTNKAKEAVKIFDLIHSVDTLRLAQTIDRHAARINKIQDILLEVNISGEKTKFGLAVEELEEISKEIAKLKNLCIKGLMTIAPIVSSLEAARPYFRRLRELKEKINALSIFPYKLEVLSMGMSDDFPVALEEGANMLRIGRRIFLE